MLTKNLDNITSTTANHNMLLYTITATFRSVYEYESFVLSTRIWEIFLVEVVVLRSEGRYWLRDDDNNGDNDDYNDDEGEDEYADDDASVMMMTLITIMMPMVTMMLMTPQLNARWAHTMTNTKPVQPTRRACAQQFHPVKQLEAMERRFALVRPHQHGTANA